MKESPIQKLLEERGSVYGDYKGGNSLRVDIMELIEHRYLEVRDSHMPKTQWMMIFDIVNKISRLAVSPAHVDTWQDIIGYSTLTVETLKKEIANANTTRFARQTSSDQD